MELPSFPKCQKCEVGVLIPLSDYGQEGASVLFKAWVCTNPDCGFSLRVDKGEVTYGSGIEAKHYLFFCFEQQGSPRGLPFFHRFSALFEPFGNAGRL